MRVSIIKNKKIKNIILPNKIVGSYWLSDIDSNGINRNLILIEAENNKWKLISNNEVYIINNDNYSFPYTYLEEGKFYIIRNQTEKKNILLYCSNDLNEYSYYDVSSFITNGISVGNKEENFVFSPNIRSPFLIQRVNNQIMVFDYNIPEGIYVNGVRVNKEQVINYGDTLFTQGLKMTFIATLENPNLIIYLCMPKREDIFIRCEEVEKAKPQKLKYSEEDEEVEYPLYDEKEYFNKKPRFDSEIKVLNVVVDAPPTKENEENSPFILTIGPMITMSMTSLVSGFTAVNGLMNGTTSMERAMPSLIICGAMFASIFIWPLFIGFYEKRVKKRNEKKRQEKYSVYIEEKRSLINNAIKEQSILLYRKYPKMSEILDVILNKRVTLWQKRITDDDYLTVSLGIGNSPMKIDIKYPEDHFSMVEDNLKAMVNKLGSEPKILNNVPITFSFKENFISGLIGEEQLSGEYMRRLLVQILAYHSYDDTKIVVLTNEENEYLWQFLKNTPHNFTDDRKMRFFASNEDEYKEICYYLEQIFNYRKENEQRNEEKNFDKNYLIITDDLKKVRSFEIINSILESKNYLGFSLFVIDRKVTLLPDQISKFIEIYGEKAQVCNNTHIEENIEFMVDFTPAIDYEKVAQTLFNIPIEFKNSEEGKLPDTIKFLEMYDIGKIEQLNILNRWQVSNPMLTLAAPVGIGKNGEKITIDLHEKYHGPHGLIAGMTGSGKSEFIITYILSMAINYHPYEVQFILIDYKGGGLAGAFENNNIGLKLPHLVGTITNLDANEIKRSLASIESELKRRQALFNEAREKTGESTIDIYKYQKMYRDGLVSEPVSHLFIISDEFAELKVQQPEFMEQLISTARIGRSLGVHLILATQKPSGVVDPQIWSNTRFRICLKVQDKSDSNDVIKCPDAAFLKQVGRFYFQVGYNEVFTLGQAAWAGGKYIPKEKVNRTIDTSLEFINNIGYPIKIRETKEIKNQNIGANYGEELINIVKYLDNLAKSQNINTRPLWLQKLPAEIRVEDLQIKYNYQKENYILNPIIGEYDIPKEQKQMILTLPLTKEGNAAIYGASGSGKENYLTTLIYSSLKLYSVNEVNYYIIDFGAETLKMFKEAPIVGDILASSDEEKIYNLFKMIYKTINERKKLFADFGGDYVSYCQNSGNTLPNIVIIINNFEAYQENFSALEEDLTILTRDCTKYGIYFVVTVSSPNGLRFKIKQNFSLFYTLQQNNQDDYATILGNVYKTYPANIYGRGLIKTDDVYEFQTALVNKREEIVKTVKNTCLEYKNKTNIKAQPIPILPEVVTYNDIKDVFAKTNELVVGIDKNTLEVVTFDYHKYYTSIISTLDLSLVENFINPLINELVVAQKTNLYVINMEDIKLNDDTKKYYKYFDKDVNELFNSLYDFVMENNAKYQANNYNKDIFANLKPITVLIIGITSFKDILTADNQNRLDSLLAKGKNLGVIDFIFIDSIDKIKRIELDSWYRANVNTSNGIWLGSGVSEQFSIKINQRIPEMRDDIPDNFCFVVKRGKVEYVKYIESFNIKS